MQFPSGFGIIETLSLIDPVFAKETLCQFVYFGSLKFWTDESLLVDLRETCCQHPFSLPFVGRTCALAKGPTVTVIFDPPNRRPVPLIHAASSIPAFHSAPR